MSKSATSTSLGASPRVIPRPEYPPITEVIVSFFREVVVQGGGHGLALSLLLFPAYEYSRELAKTYGVSDQLYFAIMTSLVHSVIYVVVNYGFYFMDVYGIAKEYKLERKPHMTPSPKLMHKMATEALIGQLITSPLISYFLYPAFMWFGMYSLDAPLPDMQELLLTFISGHMFNDIGFYWTHRLFHCKALYKTFHKQHHEFTGTIGFAAEYANPVEVIVSNQIPTVGGILFFGAHPICLWIWIGLRLQQTYEAHSGYCFDGHILDKLWLSHSDSAAHHDHHHTSNQGNFGGLYTDWLFGTMDHYQKIGGKDGYIKLKKGTGNNKKAA